MSAENDPFYEPPATHHKDGVRYGTTAEMISEIDRLRAEIEFRDKVIAEAGRVIGLVQDEANLGKTA